MVETQKISLNVRVSVVLTQAGATLYDVYAARLESLGVTGIARLRAGDEWTGELWELANIFGHGLYNGCEMPFEGVDLVIRP